jgi:hypothetical protein
MNTFYAQLCAGDTNDRPYLHYLIQLTRLSRHQVASLATLLLWNGWGVADR